MVNVLTAQPFAIQFVASCFIGYFIGSSNMAYYLGKLKGVNLREGGSGNLGASNAMILLGKRAALLTAAHDILKTVVAIWLVKLLFSENPIMDSAAGTAAVLGHVFPFYLKFRGGKGFASFLGMILALNCRFFLVMIAVVVIITILSDYIVLGTFTVILAYPLYLLYLGKFSAACIVLVGTACIFWKHKENIVRLKCGKEIGLRRTLKGKDRIK